MSHDPTHAGDIVEYAFKGGSGVALAMLAWWARELWKSYRDATEARIALVEKVAGLAERCVTALERSTEALARREKR